METITSEKRNYHKYMIFVLGGEQYGVPLLTVREVIEYKVPKPVPNSAAGFEGVINLRGDVVGIMDLRKLLKVKGDKPRCMLVFESQAGLMGAIVDRVLSVSEILEKDIEVRSSIGVKEASDCFIGVGKLDSGLITLVDLQKTTELLAT